MTEGRPGAGPGGSDLAIQATELRKRYPEGKADAVAGLSFTVARGEVFALLGPNGAGKTTTVGILTTMVRPTSGTAEVAGSSVVTDPIAVRSRVAVVPQHMNLDRSITIRENLVFHAVYHGASYRTARQRADELLGRFELGDRADDKPAWLSTGQAQRIIIARALMHRPDVLFCDEPTRGLDPAARVFVWDQVRQIRAEETSVLLTTHDMTEAETLADRVGIMDHGALLTVDTPGALIRQMRGSHVINTTLRTDKGASLDFLGTLSEVDGVAEVKVLTKDAEPDGPERVVSLRLYLTRDTATMIAPVVRGLELSGVGIRELTTGGATLEDVFLYHTGRNLR